MSSLNAHVLTDHSLLLEVQGGDLPCVEAAIGYFNPCVNLCDVHGLTSPLNRGASLLSIATRSHQPDVVACLLRNGRWVDACQAATGFTPLTIACEMNNLDIAIALLSCGANPRHLTEDDEFSSALHCAARHHHGVQCVLVLLAAGVEIDSTRPGGPSALQLALKAQNAAVYWMLLSNGANPYRLLGARGCAQLLSETGLIDVLASLLRFDETTHTISIQF